MNVLFLSPRPPDPPNKGDKIRSHHFARRLAARHRVHLGFLADGPEEEAGARAAASWAASARWHSRPRVARAVASAASALRGRPMSTGYFHSPELARDVSEIGRRESIDVSVAYCSSMAPYLEHVEGAKVLDLVDIDSEKWRQYASRSTFPRSTVYSCEHRLLRRYESEIVREFDRVVVISSAERDELARFAPVDNVDVVPNGVDAEAWKRSGEPATGEDLVFVGALDYFANVDAIEWFATHVFPRVRARRPLSRLRIVGRRPAPQVVALGRIDGVEVVGEVVDARPFVWKAAVAVAPLRIAQGLQNKVLEAMAAGTSVVATPAAVRGIEEAGEEQVLVGRNEEELADRCVRLLESPDARGRLAARARSFVESRYSWDAAAQTLERILEQAVHARAARAGALAGKGAA
jgi:sugar transferase (PEP-CTERM/EpsH1 system associated)